jgi:hypothetical protein
MNEEENIPLYDECVICYYSIIDKHHIEPCKHPVHINCFLKTKKDTCPMCRQLVTYPKIAREDYKLVRQIQVAVIIIVLWVYILITLWFYFTNLETFDSERTSS